jgi:C1A family cysteine protease
LGFCLIVLLVTATQATTDGKIGGPKPPASFDWRTVPQGNTLTPVKDQGPTCNSGWAFAAAAAYEQYVKRLNGT